MDYTKIVKALRICEDGDCSKCTYPKGEYDCDTILVGDAAAAIEALQAEVEQLKAELIDCVCNGNLD